MRVVGLISGGKDSCYNMMHCTAMGHHIVALANLYPFVRGETDSYMYQTVGSEAIEIYSTAMELPLFRRQIKGTSKEVGLIYETTADDEVEDLYQLLKDIQKEIPFDGISCGAILSDYQRIRVENVCSRLNLVSLSYLWRQDQKSLLQGMIDHQLVAIVIKTAALGLVPKLHLGKTLKEMQLHLHMLNDKYGSHICGEGGEYETFTLDCPLFKKRIVVDDSEIIIHSDDGVTSVAYMRLKSFHLEEKSRKDFDFSCLVKMPFSEADLLLTNNNFEEVQILSKQIKENRISGELDFRSNLSTRKCGPFVAISNLYGLVDSSFNEEDIVQSTKIAFAKLTELLDQYSHVLSDVVSIYFCLSKMKHFVVVNSIYKTYFKVNPPARVCITPLLSNDVEKSNSSILFLIDCLSYKEATVNKKKAMHVQSISHWAPANIGPYSQCAMVGHLCFVAGQIGLVPGTMEIVEGGIEHQAVLSLSHVKSVLSAMESTLNLLDAIQCVCYITNETHLHAVRSVWERAVNANEDLLSNVVYVVITALPRDALVEWQIVAVKKTKDDAFASYSETTFADAVDDNSHSFETLISRFLLKSEGHDEPHHFKPLQARLFYSKHNSAVKEIHGIQQRSTFPITMVPVRSVFRHAEPTRVSMALVGLSISTKK